MKTTITYLSGVEDVALALDHEEYGQYTLCQNDDQVAQVVLDDEKDVEVLCNEIEEYVNQYPNLRCEIKNDGDFLGIIVDVWADDSEELIDTATFWFEDYIVDLGI